MILENITYSREKLYKKYLGWTNNLSADIILTENNISLPYYIYLPDNWVDSKMCILIVGEEGYGYKGCSADRNVVTDNVIENMQAFNKKCIECKMNNRPFWRRFNKL